MLVIGACLAEIRRWCGWLVQMIMDGKMMVSFWGDGRGGSLWIEDEGWWKGWILYEIAVDFL